MQKIQWLIPVACGLVILAIGQEVLAAPQATVCKTSLVTDAVGGAGVLTCAQNQQCAGPGSSCKSLTYISTKPVIVSFFNPQTSTWMNQYHPANTIWVTQCVCDTGGGVVGQLAQQSCCSIVLAHASNATYPAATGDCGTVGCPPGDFCNPVQKPNPGAPIGAPIEWDSECL